MKCLTPTQFRAATYLDFEGEGLTANRELRQPHMAGTFSPNERGTGGKYQAVFYKESWAPVANGISAAKTHNFELFFKKLTDCLKESDTHLVYWSIHEEIVLKEFLSESTFANLEPHLFNMLPLARRYINRRRLLKGGETAGGMTLEDYLELIQPGKSPFPTLPIGAAEACRRIDRTCEKHKKWKHFTDVQKTYARDLVKYNEGDCRSTWLIAKKVGNFFSSLS